MKPTAQNAYTVRYSLQHPDDVRFALTFTVTGEEAELVLLQSQERAGPQDIRANPGQVDQRVYRLESIDEIKEACAGEDRNAPTEPSGPALGCGAHLPLAASSL
jgi:hypothetical protein